MKTKYETPEINILKLCVDDVIATSSGTPNVLQSKPTWESTPSGNGTWGSLWG